MINTIVLLNDIAVLQTFLGTAASAIRKEQSTPTIPHKDAALPWP